MQPFLWRCQQPTATLEKFEMKRPSLERCAPVSDFETAFWWAWRLFPTTPLVTSEKNSDQGGIGVNARSRPYS
jgi:hypothetical protein